MIFRALQLRFTPQWLRISVDRFGVEFQYYGDTLIWLWPWQRSGCKYLSLQSEGEFKTLADVRAFWDEYDDYNRKHPIG